MADFRRSVFVVALALIALAAAVASMGGAPPGERMFEQALVQSDANIDLVVTDAAVAAPSGAMAETPVIVHGTAEGSDYLGLAGACAVGKGDTSRAAEMRQAAEKRWRAWCNARRARRV